MSPRLAISATISVLLMAAFALSSTKSDQQPFGDTTGHGLIRAEALASAGWLPRQIAELLR